MNLYVTYAIFDPRSKWPVYVGQTGNFERRQADHLTTHRERKAHPPGSLQHWLKATHKARLEPEFLVLDLVETEAESLKSETKWVEKFAQLGFPLLNRWDEHKTFITEAPDMLNAMVFRPKSTKRIGQASPNKARTGWRVEIEDGQSLKGPVTIDLIPPKS
ncbi:MAG: hypothetical protein AAFR68_18455 [Pseudomonadota bacterium]